MATEEFRNESGLEFTDISSEESREYTFIGADGSAHYVLITGPLKLHVSENGHRIFDAHGTCHYIPKGWIKLEWETKPGQPHFVK